MGSAKPPVSEWFFGSQHDEILDSTLKAREREKRRLEASLTAGRRSDPNKPAAKTSKIPVMDLLRVLREHIHRYYDDIFDAFDEVDINSNGRLSKVEFREGIKGMGGEPSKFTNEQLDEVFEHMDSKSEQQLRLEQFIAAFSTDKRKKTGRDGKIEAKDSVRARTRAFQEVLMECKDEKGTQKNIAVKVSIKWEELLEKLKSAFRRPVTFMYEDAGKHRHAVKDAQDLIKCWDSLAMSGKGEEGSMHLECMIIDFDATTTAKAKGTKGGRPSLEERRRGAAKVRGDKATEGDRDPVESLDFRSRHKWIDDMMRLLGAPLENEPAAMHNKWDVLIKECKQLDGGDTGIVTVEGFRNALIRTEPRMTAEHVEWFVQDADKDTRGDVLYEAYANTKKQGQSAGTTLRGDNAAQQREVLQATDKITNALKTNFKSLQQAFKRMDVDRDGRLSREEFRKGIEQRLKLRLPPKLLDEVIRKADQGGDGFIDYEDFLEHFNVNDRKDSAGKDDGLTDEEITRMILSARLNIAEIFKEMDDNGDGVLSMDELSKGLDSLGIHCGRSRVLRFMASMDIDGNRSVDYREFLRKLSSVQLHDVHRVGWDENADLEDKVRRKLREQYDDAKHAFHAWDLDADGRLSEKEFSDGIKKLAIPELNTKDENGDVDENNVKLQKLFEHVNMAGDGFVSYHEFLFRFPIRPKPLNPAPPFDQELRAVLQKKFLSVTDAFMKLDLDHDNRLSKKDLVDGLQQNGIWEGKFKDEVSKKDLEDKIAGLLERSASADKSYLDYYDFIVRFGLNSKADGKWVYVPEKKKDDARPFLDLAKKWRDIMPPSKWRGRGGIRNSIERFNDGSAGANGEMKERQFLEALRDGLMMTDKLDEAAAAMLTKGRPWTTTPKDDKEKDKDGNKLQPTININKFFTQFLDVYFEQDKILYDVLLVQNRWLDMRLAFSACSSVLCDSKELDPHSTSEGKVKLISKFDFGNALQMLVEKSKLAERERQVIIHCCEEQDCFVREGRYVGYINYETNFFEKFIPDEIEIYGKVFKYWEDCDAQFEKLGSALSYSEFEQLCRDIVGRGGEQESLTANQINFLIDVVDSNGDGTVGRSEFLERYAREDAAIQMALRTHWHPLMELFHKENKTGVKSSKYELTADQFQKALLKGLENNLLGTSKITPEQLTDIVTNLDKELKTKDGKIQYDKWLQKYVKDYYVTHQALTGTEPTSKMPKWDAIIASFETLDKCRIGSRNIESDHMVSWDHFHKALRMAAIELTREQVQKIIDKLDPDMTGSVRWIDMVSGPVAPFFFNGKQDYEMRQLMCQGWPALYEKCKAHEMHVRKTDKTLLPTIENENKSVQTMGVLTPAQLKDCLKDTPALNLIDQNDKENPLVKKIIEVCEQAFIKLDPRDEKKLLDRNDKHVINYEAMCRHYAGASFDAEREFERKWEVVIEVLKELKDQYAGRQLSRDAFKVRLSTCDLHVSDATIDYLLRDQAVATVDMDLICWKTAKGTILKILKKKWALLLQLFRAKDSHNRRRLDRSTVQAVLDRADVGMSTSLVEILLQNLVIEDDGKIDYDKLLSGKLKNGTFPIEVYTAYKTMESEWETLSQHFWEYDLNGDGIVNHDEFRQALRNLQHPALAEQTVITDLIKQLDPEGDPKANTDNINFDKFSWDMARTDLKQVVEQSGREMLAAFRAAATRDFERFRGKLPAPKAIEAINKALHDTGVKPILIKILVSRAEIHKKKGVEEDPNHKNLIEETQLSMAFREIAGDSFEKAEQTTLRESFLMMLGASRLSVMDKWRIRGEDHTEIKRLSGAASLGAEPLRHVGPSPLKRSHMHGFLGQGGQFMLESMAASPALVDIKEDRVKTIYGRDPWISFWQLRSSYRSPALSTPQSSIASTSAVSARPHPATNQQHSAPQVATSRVPLADPGTAQKRGGVDKAWDVVREKVRKAAFERFQTNEEALNALDPENPGAGAIATQSLHQVLEAMIPSLNASELEMIVEKLDPGRDGMVLKSDFAYALLPPSTDRSSLEKLAQERHARGIYARLRGRQTQSQSPLHNLTHSQAGIARKMTSGSPSTTTSAHHSIDRTGYAGQTSYLQRSALENVQHQPAVVRQSYLPTRYGRETGAGTGEAARPGAYSGNATDPWTGRDLWPHHELHERGLSYASGYQSASLTSGQHYAPVRRDHFGMHHIPVGDASSGWTGAEPNYESLPSSHANNQKGPVRDVDVLDDMYRSTMEQVGSIDSRDEKNRSTGQLWEES